MWKLSGFPLTSIWTLNNFDKQINNYQKKLPVLDDDTKNIIEYVEQKDTKKKRKCEKDQNFTERFIKISRDVHFLNDNRAQIKLEINNHTGSKIKEIKEYTKY